MDEEKKSKPPRPTSTWRNIPALDLYAHFCALILKNGFWNYNELVNLIINCDAYNNNRYSPSRQAILRKFNFLKKKTDDHICNLLYRSVWYGHKDIYHQVKDIFKNSKYSNYLSNAFEKLNELERESQRIEDSLKEPLNKTDNDKNEVDHSPEIIKKLRVEDCLQNEEVISDNRNNNNEFPNIEFEKENPATIIINENKLKECEIDRPSFSVINEDKKNDEDGHALELEWFQNINECGEINYIKYKKNKTFAFSINQKSIPRLIYCIKNIERDYEYKEEFHKYLKDAIDIHGVDGIPYITDWAYSFDVDQWMFLTQAVALRISSKQILSLLKTVSYKGDK